MSDRDRDYDSRRSRDMDDDDSGPSFRRGERARRDLDDDLEEEDGSVRRDRPAYRDDDDEAGISPPERASARSGIGRFILPVGGGLLAGGALLAGLSLFLAEEVETVGVVSPPVVSPAPQAVAVPTPVAPATAPPQAVAGDLPRGALPGLASGFGQGGALPSIGQPGSIPGNLGQPGSGQSAGVLPGAGGAPLPMLGGAGGQPPAAPIMPTAPVGVPPVSVSPGERPAEVAAPRVAQDEVRRLEERIARGEERAQELQARLAEAAARIDRYRRGNEALLASIADLRAEIDLQDDAIAEFRRALEERARQASVAQPPPEPAPVAPAAAPRTPPVQIPIRLASFNSNTRLALSFPSEPVYDVDQRDNDVRVRFLGGELPNLLGLPAQIRNIESVASAPGLLEIRVAEGVTVRHAQVGAQISLSFFNRGVEPPATAGAAPRERRPDPARQEEVQPPAVPQVAPTTEASRPVSQPPSSREAPAAATAPQVASSSPASTPAAGREAPVSPPAAQPPSQASVQPPAAASLAGLRLRSVSRRAVLVETSAGDIHRVELGETLPNSSAIAQEVRRDGEEWVLVTSVGVLRP